jgi:hypothetical protein
VGEATGEADPGEVDGTTDGGSEPVEVDGDVDCGDTAEDDPL